MRPAEERVVRAVAFNQVLTVKPLSTTSAAPRPKRPSSAHSGSLRKRQVAAGSGLEAVARVHNPEDWVSANIPKLTHSPSSHHTTPTTIRSHWEAMVHPMWMRRRHLATTAVAGRQLAEGAS